MADPDAVYGYLDTNVVVYFLAGTPPDLAGKARALLEQASDHRLLIITALVVAECVWVLESKGFGYPEGVVAARLTALLTLPGILCPEWDVVVEALTIHGEARVDFVDAYLAASASIRGPRRVYTRNVRDFRHHGLELPAW